MTNKTILFFISDAGGGHRASARSLQEHLQEKHEGVVVPIVNFWKVNGSDFVERIYNYLLKIDLGILYWAFLVPFFEVVMFITGAKRRAVRVTAQYLQNLPPELKPQVIISNAPVYNRILVQAIQVAWGEDRPDLLVIFNDPEDYDDDRYSYVFPKQSGYDGCWFACPREQLRARVISKGHAPSRAMATSGFIIPPHFYDSKLHDQDQKGQLRKSLGFDAQVPTICVMYGAAGSRRMLAIAQFALRTRLKAQFIFLCGRDERLRKAIQTLPFHWPVKVEGFTDRVHEYMSVSDIMISKPGPGTLSEAAHLGLPVIIFDDFRILAHERANLRELVANRRGMVIRSIHEMPQAVNALTQTRSRESQGHAAQPANRGLFEVEAFILERLSARCPMKSGFEPLA